MSFTDILIASHGTPGARAAETLALDLAAANGARVTHLYVVADFWLGMRGDDWLNNVSGRMRYERHLEDQLQRDMEAEFTRLDGDAARRGLTCGHRYMVGKPHECLLEMTAAGGHDLVVIGSPRPKGAKGFRSRMTVEPLVQGLGPALLVAPHPAR